MQELDTNDLPIMSMNMLRWTFRIIANRPWLSECVMRLAIKETGHEAEMACSIFRWQIWWFFIDYTLSRRWRRTTDYFEWAFGCEFPYPICYD